MFEVSIGGETFEAEVSFYTAALYEMEFRKDLLKDFFGDVLRLSDQVEVDDDMNIVNIDFDKINWMASGRVLWAAIKTADSSTPGDYEWSKTTSGLNLWNIREKLASEVSDCFFRPDAAEEDIERG